MGPAGINVFSIDLEEWFCVYNLSQVIPYEHWDRCESRVEPSTLAILDLLSKHHVEGTFFVLGWVAERHPELVREVERRGHEIATHGYSHRLITHLSRDEFRADLERSLEVLTPLASKPIRGFRAPSFSVTRKTWWALDILRECGIHYDSSMFPISFHPDYGVPEAPLTAHHLSEGIWEMPMSVAEVAGKRVPCCGGGYFRQFPYAVTRSLMQLCNRQGRPVNFYLHPWEVDPDQPRMPLPLVKRVRHYNNLAKTMPRLERLLSDFAFTSARVRYGAELASSVS
jgi:polysaccharide deacetylase family protein (PEP-CTERM system associated)